MAQHGKLPAFCVAIKKLFTLKKVCVIILVVKKLIAVSLVGACLCTASAFIPAFASAEEGVNLPASFATQLTLTQVSDFALHQNGVAFAAGNEIVLYTYGQTGKELQAGAVERYTHTAAVIQVAYEKDTLHFEDSTGAVFAYPAEQSEVTMADSAYNSLTTENYIYDVKSGHLAIINRQTLAITKDENNTYKRLKEFENSVYVLQGDTLCKIEGETVTPLTFGYEDFAPAEQIATANIATVLQTQQNVEIVTLTADARLIEVDLAKSSQTFACKGVVAATDGQMAQCLARSGNAALIADKNKTYLTLQSNVTTDNSIKTNTEPAFTQGYAITQTGVYATPFVNEKTLLTQLQTGTQVTVLAKVTNSAFYNDFYLIEDANGTKGYAVCSFFSQHSFESENLPPQKAETEASYQNNLQAAVLVMVVVGLVIIAITYLTLVSTSDKYKKQKRFKKDNDEQASGA